MSFLHIFDMDGTLLDSMHLWRDIDHRYLAMHHIAYTDEQLDVIKNMTNRECADYFIKTFHINKAPEVMMAEWAVMAKDSYEYELQLKPFAADYLKLIHQRHDRMILATSCDVKFASAALKRLKVLHYFERIITTHELGIGKDKPAFFTQCAELMNAEPNMCIVYEDLNTAICSAAAAGMQTIGVYDASSHDDRHLLKENAARFIKSFKELL